MDSKQDARERDIERSQDWQREPLPDPFADRAVQERIASLIARAAVAPSRGTG